MSIFPRLAPASGWVTRFAPLVARDRTVLDVACGNGRHSRLFSERGNQITAVDIDLRGIADLANLPNVTCVKADLEGTLWPFGDQKFGAIIVTNYHHRPLLPTYLAALEPDGVAIYEGYAVGNQRFGNLATNVLLRSGELLEWAQGAMRVVAYEHGEVSSPKAAVVQRMVAIKDAPSLAGHGHEPPVQPLPSL
ncbi:MAG: class I SAM-dependent methyltransferase [Pseudomonadota bacterium]